MSSVMRLCLLGIVLAPMTASAAAPPTGSSFPHRPAAPPLLRLPAPEEEPAALDLDQQDAAPPRNEDEAALRRCSAEERQTESKLDPDVVFVSSRRFTIPIRVTPEPRNEAREFVLYLSRDRGMTWEAFARATPDRKGFDFFVSDDGLFYFIIATVRADGHGDQRHDAGGRS